MYFVLGNSFSLAKHLGGRGLVELDLAIDDANHLQHVDHTQPGDLRCGNGLIKRKLHEALCGQVVDFLRLRLLDEAYAIAQVGQIVIHQVQTGVITEFAGGAYSQKFTELVRRKGPMYRVALLQQQFRQVRAVLTRDAGNRADFPLDVNRASLPQVYPALTARQSTYLYRP